MALVHGKKCWTIIEPNVVFITTLANTCFPRSPLLEGYVLKRHSTLQAPKKSLKSSYDIDAPQQICTFTQAFPFNLECVLVDCFHLFFIMVAL